MTEQLKKYPVIAACGIDCALCPRFYTSGPSRCPGCGGSDFKEKHPSCGILSCCVLKQGLEVCAQCREFPCIRFEPEKILRDSFVTHQKIFPNHEYIQKNGLPAFLERQEFRIRTLSFLLENFDDGRSKAFYCRNCALLPLQQLAEIRDLATGLPSSLTAKEKNKRIRSFIMKAKDATETELIVNV